MSDLSIMQEKVKDGQTIAVWFSCGAASAVAAHETVRLFGGRCHVKIVNNPVMEEGWDNRRFLADCETWIGQRFEIATHSDYPMASAAEVWERRKGMSFTSGAPCTLALKKQARQQWEKRNPVDWHVLGFHAEEQGRHDRFVLTERPNVLPVLIALGIDKNAAAEHIASSGIALPLAYRLGFPNANCIGCVKATSPTYWNHVREKYPEIFAARAEQSARIGAKLVRVNDVRIPLTQLDPAAKGRPLAELKMPDCGLFCEEGESRD